MIVSPFGEAPFHRACHSILDGIIGAPPPNCRIGDDNCRSSRQSRARDRMHRTTMHANCTRQSPVGKATAEPPIGTNHDAFDAWRAGTSLASIPGMSASEQAVLDGQ